MRLRLALLTLCWFGGFTYAQIPDARPPTLKSLDTILTEFRTAHDFTKASYLFKRCSGYSLATSALLIRSGGDQLKERSDEWRKIGIDLLEYAVDTEIRIDKQRSPQGKKSKDEWVRETIVIAREFAGIYIERMNSNYTHTGNYVFDDPWLAAEHEICQQAPKKVMETLQ